MPAKAPLWPTTDSAYALSRYPNLIKNVEPEWPARKLAVGHNLHSTIHRLVLSGVGLGRLFRYSMGWSLACWVDTLLTLSALQMTLDSRRPDLGLIYRCNQGVKYASGEAILRLE